MRYAPLSPFTAALIAEVLLAGAPRAQPSFFRRAEIKIVGELQYGERSDRVQYTPTPLYRALHFEGKPGERVDIRVESIDGQAMAALTDSRFKPIVSNFGSHITTVLPPSAEPYPITYYVVFREARKNPATFTVVLNRVGAQADKAEDYYACTADSDCIAIPEESCCQNGYKAAVNRNRVAAYRAANACKLSNPLCPHLMVNDTRVARCDHATHQCRMVRPPPPPPRP